MFVNTWKNILKFWRLSRTCRNSRKSVSIFRNSGSVCKYLEISWIARRSKITFLKSGKSWNVLQASGSLRVFVNAWKNILKLWGLSRTCRNSRKYLATSGSLGVFVNTWKNILKLWRLCRTCRNSRKYVASSRSLGVFVNTWKKYSEALGTFYNL